MGGMSPAEPRDSLVISNPISEAITINHSEEVGMQDAIHLLVMSPWFCGTETQVGYDPGACALEDPIILCHDS